MEQPEVGDSLITFLDDPQPQPKESSVSIDFSNCSFKALIEDLPSAFEESFYENIERFLDLCNKIHAGVSTCKLLHKNSQGVRRVPLYIMTCTVLEDQTETDPFCNYCSSSGWRYNRVSKFYYHFIIPADDEWGHTLDNAYDEWGNILGKGRKYEDQILSSRTHLLHGIIHSNGMGHLICLNGREGSPHHITRTELMYLWDVICLYFHARKISVRDETCESFQDGEGTIRTMNLRLIYSVAYGHPWFGKWHYEFGHGSYGVSKDDYEKSAAFLGLISVHQLGEMNALKFIIRYYKKRSHSHVKELKDLLSLMLSESSSSRRSKHVANDNLWTIYTQILMEGGFHTRNILNSKVFIKDYTLNNFPHDGMATEFSVKDIDGRDMKGMISIPVMLYPPYSVVKEFIREKVSKIYHVAPTCRIVEIGEDLKGRGWVRISGIENSDSYMAEGGRGWVVECSCGATDDDGEPMIQCDQCQNWYHNACCGLNSSTKHNGYWRCPDCMLLPSDIDNFNLLVDASLCDLEKQIGKENHAEHASQCAPKKGLDKENRAKHAPLCVPEKCIEKEYQEILSFRNRNVLAKLSLEEQKLIEGYWTDAAQTGDLFWNGLDSHNRTVGREDLGHLLSDAEISNGVVDSYAVLLTEDMVRDGVSNQFVMSCYAWMFVEDENEGGKQLHMSHPLLAKLGVSEQIFFPLLAKEERHFTLLVFKKNEKKWIFMDPFFNRQGADKSFHQAKTMKKEVEKWMANECGQAVDKLDEPHEVMLTRAWLRDTKTFDFPLLEEKSCPQQHPSSVDCGPMILYYIERLARGASVEVKADRCFMQQYRANIITKFLRHNLGWVLKTQK